MTTAPPSVPLNLIHGRKPHAVIIGSGFGGLAAAVRLGARGYRVTVLERLDAPGGRAYVHRQDGFSFDAGPTIITAPFLLDELWGLCGKRFADDVELRLMDPFYRIRFDDGAHFDYSGNPERIRAEILRFAPEDLAGYERFLKQSEAIYRVGYEQLAHVPFSRFMDMVRIIPPMVKLQSYRSVYSLVSSFVKNDRMRT
ncbi:MAG TPA: FAD-dependent oxidoreductase, partial [Lamprocystis sp. (in: g-proteobacteria)]|nr:FAD-dependent oxidoreductase [Lamprocystis sp. (in: g-proteobacteria)]